jgi:hypothetical protein
MKMKAGQIVRPEDAEERTPGANDATLENLSRLVGARRLREEIENVSRHTVDTRLIAFGLEDADRKDLQEDLRHLRGLRKRAEQVHSFILKAVITGVLTGGMGAAWLGLKSILGR